MRSAIAFLFLLSCASTELPNPPQNGIRIEVQRHTPTWITYYDHLLGSSDALYSPSLRFDLSSLPPGKSVRRALLRLRRGYEEIAERRGPRAYAIEVTNVNKGFRILRAEVSETWQHPGEIVRAEEVTGEEALWTLVPGTSDPGMALSQTKYGPQTYVALLKSWNPTIPARLVAAARWDEIDVTSFVAEELRGDRSITLLLSANTPIHLGWFDTDPERRLGSLQNRPELFPHLLVELDEVPSKAPIQETPGSARLRVRSTPAPAKIYLEGEFVGTTLEGELVELPASPGKVRLRLEKKGYKPWEETVRLADGALLPIHAELEPE